MTFELNWRAALAASFASDSYEEVAPATGPTMITTLAFDSAVEAEAAGTAREIAIRKARDRALRSLGNGSLRGSADQLVAQPPNRMWRASPDSRMGAPDSMRISSRARNGPNVRIPGRSSTVGRPAVELAVVEVLPGPQPARRIAGRRRTGS